MPTYSAVCLRCGSGHDYVRRVNDRNDTPECCDGKTQRMLDTPMTGAMSFTGAKSFAMLDGTYIEDGAAYKKYLDKNNLIPESEGSREHHIQKDRKEVENKKAIKESVVEAYRQMQAQGKI